MGMNLNGNDARLTNQISPFALKVEEMITKSEVRWSCYCGFSRILLSLSLSLSLYLSVPSLAFVRSRVLPTPKACDSSSAGPHHEEPTDDAAQGPIQRVLHTTHRLEPLRAVH